MRCKNCAYLLEHLTEHRCPECGLEFDPHDASTFEQPIRPWVSRIRQIAFVWLTVWATFFLLGFIPFVLYPRFDGWYTIASVIEWIGVSWLIASTVFVVVYPAFLLTMAVIRR